jgi:hypothetical protein
MACALSMAGSFSVQAQRAWTDDNEQWWGVLTSGQIAPKYALWLDGHYVNELFWIARAGLTYQTTNGRWAITGGYAYLRLRAPFSEGQLVRPEHRPWGQVVYRLPSKGPLSASFRFRYDMRFRANVGPSEIEEGYQFNNRLRFNVGLRYDLRKVMSKPFQWSTSLLNEGLITVGPDAVTNPYEHRIFTMLHFKRNAITLSPGYIMRFLNITPTTAQFRHGFVFWVTVNYSFWKKSTDQQMVAPEDGL